MQTDTTERLESPPALDDPSEVRAGDSTGGAAPEDVVPETAPPVWFKPRGESAERVSTAPPIRTPTRPEKGRKRTRIVVESNDPDEPRDWRKSVVLWVTGFAGAGYGTSLVLHGILLAALGLWFLDLDFSGPRGSTQLGFSEDDAQGFDFGQLDNLHDEAGGKTQEEEVTRIEVSQLLADEGDPVEETRDALDAAVASELPTTGQGDGTQDGDGTNANAGGGRKMGSNSVTKGSFTVVVTPTGEPPPGKSLVNYDPEPGEPYFVYIMISLPESVETLSVNDISGSIKGTDGWQTMIPWDDKGFHPPGHRYTGRLGATTYYKRDRPGRGVPFRAIGERDIERDAEIPVQERIVDGEVERSVILRVPVLGAVINPITGRVRDNIKIECKPLDEKQDFQIEF